MSWEEFLIALNAAGGSIDMQTSKTGRYPFLFHFARGEVLTNVVIYASIYVPPSRVLTSPPRDWSTRDLILSDYRALQQHGGYFNDTRQALLENGA